MRFLLLIFFLNIQFVSAGNPEADSLRTAFNAAYDHGHYGEALNKADDLIAYWRKQNQKDSIYYYRYKRVHTLSQSGEPNKAVQEARSLIAEMETEPSPPKFLSALYFSYGKSVVFLSEFAEATRILNKCIEYETNRPRPDLSIIANAMEWKGIAYTFTDSLDKAQTLIEEALRLRYLVYDSMSTEIAYTLNSLAGLYLQRSMLAETDAAYSEAYRIMKLHLPPDHPHISSIASNLSNVKSSIGEIRAALTLLETAIAGHEKLNDYYALIYEYHNLGDIYTSSLHDNKRARIYFLRSLNLADSLLPKPHYDRANIYDALGSTYLSEEEYATADSLFLLGYRERLSMNDVPESRLGQSTFNLGLTSEGLGNDQRAEAYYSKSLEYFLSSYGDFHPKTANTLFNLANMSWSKGNHKEAIDSYRNCLNIYTSNLTSRHAYPLQTNITLARCFEEIHQPDSVNRYIQKAWINVCDTKDEPINIHKLSKYPIAFIDPEVLNLIDFHLSKLINERRKYGTIKNINDEIELMKVMDKLMTALWPMLNFENETSSLLPLIKSIYRKGALLAKLNGSDSEDIRRLFLNSIEQSQSASIRSALQNRQAMHYANVPDSILEKDRRLRERQYVVRTNAENENLKLQEKLIFNAFNEWRDFQNNLAKDYPNWYEARYAPITPSLQEIQENLSDSDASLVAYITSDTVLVLVHAVRNDLQTYLTPLDPTWRDSVRIYRELIENRAKPDRLANLSYYLYNLFWKPIEGKVKKKVMLMPDATLNFLNFETLISDLPSTENYGEWDWLIKKHVFLYRNHLPRNDKAIKIVKKEILALAPGFSDELKDSYNNNLPGNQFPDSTFMRWVQTPWSVDLAKEFESSGKVFIGQHATKSAFKENAGTADILHFGTHALLNDAHPLNSYLALMPQPAKEDGGYLYAYELYNQPLQAQLAILTACETGIGTYREGDGVISLAHAFRYAGCPNVMYSLWKIDDQQSTWLIRNFYKHIDHNNHFSDALHLAKIDYLNEHSGSLNAPYYWAGIVLTGSDGKLIPTPAPWRKYAWLGLGGIGLIAIVIIVRSKRNIAA